MHKLILQSALAASLVASCAEHTPRDQPQEAFPRGDQWRHAPPWAAGAIRHHWWTEFGDSRLDAHVATALSNNVGLRVLAARLERARAQREQARAATWPAISVGTGLVYGNEQTRMTGFRPTDLEPWASSAAVTWEIDLFGKLRAATRSAQEAEAAAFWDLHAARLLVASQVADAHFRILRLNEERSIVAESVAANGQIVQTMRDRERAGLISTTELRRQEAEHERLSRAVLDLDRLRGLALLELETLRGGRGGAFPSSRRSSAETEAPSPSQSLSSVRQPALPSRTTTEVLRTRPDLLAAEARVRAAFQIEESARLNLLPSLALRAGASGESLALASGFRSWMASVGPRLEVPIYDPQRLAAVRVRRAETDEAAATYRQTALQAFEDVESAYLNSANRRRQLAAAHREVDSLEEARRNTLATLAQGLVSQVELLESERKTLEARREELAIRHALLRDHLALVRALGGAAK